MSLSPLDLDALLLGMQQRWSWPERSTRYVPAGQWKSRTAMFYRCKGSAGEPDVVVKVLPHPRGNDVALLAEAMERLGRVLTSNEGTAVHAPPLLGWAEAPPALCTRHIDGTDIFFMFKDLEHPAWGQVGWTYEEVVTECGRSLGAVHSAPRESEPGPSGSDRVALVDRDFESAASAVFAPRLRIEEMRPRLAIAPAFGDFGPHQFRLSREGVLFLLDPPLAGSWAPVHGDLARFVFGLTKILGDASKKGMRRRRRLGPVLIDAFLAGYSETGPVDPRVPDERRLLGFYIGRAAAGIAHKRLKQGRLVAAGRHGAQWVREVRAARL